MMYVAGEWTAGARQEDVRSPFDGEVVGAVAVASADDAERAVTAAVEGAGFGMPTWASVSNGVAAGLASAQWIALFGLALAPLLTMLAAWLPARHAADLPIIEAIRDEVSALHRKRPRRRIGGGANSLSS